MIDRLNVNVSGSEEIGRQFARAGDDARARLREALLNLARRVQTTAQSVAPQRTGKLRKSIKAAITQTDKSITASVKPGKFYAQFVEYGVVAHGSRRNKRTTGHGKAGAQRVRALRERGIWRIRPHPFMKPAADAVASDVGPTLQAALNAAAREG